MLAPAPPRDGPAAASSLGPPCAADVEGADASSAVAVARRRDVPRAAESDVPAGARELTVPEDEAVGSLTQRDNRGRFGCFTRGASSRGLSQRASREADEALVAWLNEQCFEGEPLATGAKMLAALGHLLPGVSRGALELRRSRRAIQELRRHNPTAWRLPSPWPVVAALTKDMLARGQLAAAGATMFAFGLLLRPAEARRLTGGCLVALMASGAASRRRWSIVLHPQERGLTSKVGAQDECLVFDSLEFDLIVPLFKHLQRSVADGHPYFDVGAGQWVEALRASSRRLLPSRAGPTLYQLRPGGAPRDVLTEFRATEGPMRRGRRTACDETGGRVNQALGSLTAAGLERAPGAERALGARLSATFHGELAQGGSRCRSFAGTGRFSHCWRQQAPRGLPIYEVDLSCRQSHDLSSRAAQRLILDWTRPGCCKAVWFSTPCSTSSRAWGPRAGPPRLRSDKHPLGLDNPGEAGQVRGAVANELARFSTRELLACLQMGAPGALENPESPRLWRTPFMQDALRRRGGTATDSCMGEAHPELRGPRAPSFSESAQVRWIRYEACCAARKGARRKGKLLRRALAPCEAVLPSSAAVQ
ncbi:unnamed protein product [Prorocentrum cordatum]|uniref:Uncharacterized protein n=1 Tax=Prorocentrum cordatum TaxID=2364126 RepID=A0ABN9QPK2_9DINO|nr:unnamed protein product [Polarella glacialis]